MENTITFEKISDLDEAKKMWHRFSPQMTLYDNWDFRYCFYKYFQYDLHFLVGYIAGEAIGLLPLQFNSKGNYLEFFGDYEGWMDQNKVFIKPGYESFIQNFYQGIELPARLTALIGEDDFTKTLPAEDFTHILPLSAFTSHEQYFATRLSKDTGKNFQKTFERIEKEKIEVVRNNFFDLETLFEFNIKHFGEDSSFVWPYRKEIFRDFTKLPLSQHLTTFKQNDKILGVCYSLLYNGIYTGLNMGGDADVYKDINTYILIKDIDEALHVGAAFYDARGGNHKGKERWHFDALAQYSFYK